MMDHVVSLAKVAAARAEEAGIGIQIGADEYEFEYSIRASGGTSDNFTVSSIDSLSFIRINSYTIRLNN